MRGQGTLVTMSKWSKLKTLNKMVAKDKDEEEEEEEPVYGSPNLKKKKLSHAIFI